MCQTYYIYINTQPFARRLQAHMEASSMIKIIYRGIQLLFHIYIQERHSKMIEQKADIQNKSCSDSCLDVWDMALLLYRVTHRQFKLSISMMFCHMRNCWWERELSSSIEDILKHSHKETDLGFGLYCSTGMERLEENPDLNNMSKRKSSGYHQGIMRSIMRLCNIANRSIRSEFLSLYNTTLIYLLVLLFTVPFQRQPIIL